MCRFLALKGDSEGHRDVIHTRSPSPPADVYPSRPVRIVEPFGAGGGPDLLARVLASHLAELWGQIVTVENVTGAGATAGPAKVARSPADGYTLLLNTSAQAYGSAVSQQLPYDPLSDFLPVIPLTIQPYALVVGDSAGVTSVGELIAAAKAKPGRLKFGSTGIGTGTHIGAEKFNQLAGIDVLHLPPLPTDTNADTIAATIAGRVTYQMVPIALALPAIRAGHLVALGVTTTRRSPLIPEVPTIAEAGLAAFSFPIWYGVWVRSGAPEEVVEGLVKDIGCVLARQEVSDWIAEHGGERMYMTQPEFADFVLSEIKSAAQIIKAAGVMPNGPGT